MEGGDEEGLHGPDATHEQTVDVTATDDKLFGILLWAVLQCGNFVAHKINPELPTALLFDTCVMSVFRFISVITPLVAIVVNSDPPNPISHLLP